MLVRLLALSATSLLMVSACATSQENPNYKYSTKYKGAAPQSIQSATSTYSQPTVQSASYVQTQSAAPVTYQSTPYTSSTYQGAQYQSARTAPATYTRVNHECLKEEQKRELIGGALGGTIGAFAGKELIGGTKGTVIGAAVGGTAGYGIGDKTINCNPVQIQASQPITTPQYATAPTQYYSTNTAPVQPAPTYQVQQPTYTAPTDQAYGDTYGTPGYHAVMAAQGNPQPTQPALVPQQPVQMVQIPQPAPVYYQPQVAVTPAAAIPQPQYGNTQVAFHEVIEGDTVYSLSKRQCVGVDDIQRLNGLNANFNIRLGDYIKLPASRC